MSCTYITTEQFNRIEAVHGGRVDPADPVWLHVRVTPAEDLHNEIESALIQGAAPHGNHISHPDKHPFRISTGTWGYAISPELYEPGKLYTVHWRYSMSPDVMNVSRNNFIWNPVQAQPHCEENCLIYGVMTRNNIPVAGARIVVEQYKDFVTLNHRTAQIDVTTDAFGYWWLEVPANTLQRVIIGSVSKTVRVGADCAGSAAAFKDLPEYQPEDGQKDPWGYPYPAGGATNTPGNLGVCTESN